MLPTVPDQWTYTPLHAAASYGQRDMLRFLLTHPRAPAQAIETTDEDGDTPLFVCEDVAMARLLVEEFGANAKHENKAGDTPAAAAEENEHPDVAAYLRSITGEEPMYATLQDLHAQDGVALGGDGIGDTDAAAAALAAAAGGGNSAVDAAIEARTEALMERVQAILQRAEARGASSADDMTPEEEAELRRVVGESVFAQIRQGWGASADDGAEAPTDTPTAARHSSGAHDPNGEDDVASNGTNEDAVPGPGR